MKFIAFSLLAMASSMSLSAFASTAYDLDDKAIALANAVAKCPAEFADAMEGATRIDAAKFVSPRPTQANVNKETHTLTMVKDSPDGIWSTTLATLEITKLTIVNTLPGVEKPVRVITYHCQVSRD